MCFVRVTDVFMLVCACAVAYMAERKRDSSETGYGASDEDGGEDEAEGPLRYAEDSRESLERIFDTTGNSGEDGENGSEGYSVQQADDESGGNFKF